MPRGVRDNPEGPLCKSIMLAGEAYSCPLPRWHLYQFGIGRQFSSLMGLFSPSYLLTSGRKKGGSKSQLTRPLSLLSRLIKSKRWCHKTEGVSGRV